MAEQAYHEPVQIVAAGLEHLEAAGEVLARAFQNEASANWILDLSTAQARVRFAHALTLSLIHYYARGYTTLVALQGPAVVGVAVLSRPDPLAGNPGWRARGAAWPHLPGLLGLALHLRWRNIAAAGRAIQAPRQLRESHDTLEWLAVAPGRQGRGIGRMLLAELAARQSREANPRGIYAYTIGADNRAFYEACGYQLLSRVEADATFVVYHMILSLCAETH